MSATVDANVLLYASDSASPRHPRAAALLADVASGPQLLYVFWPVVMAYLRISTHPAVFSQPLSPEIARENVTTLLSQPLVRTAGETEGFWADFQRVSHSVVVRGNLVSDAHIAALMRQHDVALIWTADRDFRQFDGLAARDPFG